MSGEARAVRNQHEPALADQLLAGVHARQLRREIAGPLPPLGERLAGCRTVLVVSSAGDPTARHFHETCRRLGLPVSWVTTADIAEKRLSIGDFAAICADASGIYRRGLGDDPAHSGLRPLIRARVATHRNVIECGAASSNWSKPLHAARMAAVLKRFGGTVPATRVTSSPPPGSLVKPMSAHPGYTLDAPEGGGAGPGLFMAQARATGTEKRVHVVGDRCFVHAVHHRDTDYRTDATTRIETAALAPRWQDACLALARAEGLVLAGIDLFEDGGEACFIEVNPMPGYDGFERACPGDASITRALHQTLGGRDEIPTRSGRHQDDGRGDAHPHPAHSAG